MRIDSIVRPFKSVHGKILGFIAGYCDVQTQGVYPSKELAAAKLGELIQFRCSSESATVKVISIRGHVGIFSHGLLTGTETRHVAPGDSGACRSVACSAETLQEAEESFRYNIAQLTWDGTLAPCDILPDSRQREFRSWTEWQLRYKYAVKILARSDVQAREYANDPRNPHQSETGPCCIKDGCGVIFDPLERETRAVETLVPFWLMYCPKHRAQ